MSPLTVFSAFDLDQHSAKRWMAVHGAHGPDDFGVASIHGHLRFALCENDPISKAYFQNCFVAMRAPSAMAANLAHTTSGSTAAWPTQRAGCTSFAAPLSIIASMDRRMASARPTDLSDDMTLRACSKKWRPGLKGAKPPSASPGEKRRSTPSSAMEKPMTPFPKQASCRTHRESGERLKAFTFERSTRSEAGAGSGAAGKQLH